MSSELFEESDQYRAFFDILPDNQNKVYVKIFGADRQQYNRAVGCLNTNFSFKDPEASQKWEYKHGFYDGMIKLFDISNNSFDLGMISRACEMLKKGVPEIKIELSKSIWAIFRRPDGNLSDQEVKDYIASLNLRNIVENFPINPYDHQYKLFERAVNGRRISLVACTGAGKSLAQYALSRFFVEKEKKKTLIIVPSAGLVEQMYHDFKYDYGWEDIDKHCTMIYADSKDKLSNAEKGMLEKLGLGEETKLRDVVVSTWQSLLRKDPSFFLVFGAVIVDEAHGAKADELRRIVDQCTEAAWKIGVSGTIPDSGLDAALIEGSLGRREEIVRSAELIEKGILTPVEIHSLSIPYDVGIRPWLCRQDYPTEFSLVTGNGSRKQVSHVLFRANQITTDQNTLMLFKRKESIDIMKEFMEKYYPQYKIYIIKGEVKPAIREIYRNEVEKSTGNIILATFGTMKQGVNIKLLHNLMFCEFSKSMYEIVQSIGRILRKHKDKSIARVFDLVDNASYITKKGFGNYTENYAMEHYKKRMEYYYAEKFPIIELEVPFTASIDPVELDRKKKEAANKAASKKTKKASVPGKGSKSKFIS